MNRACLRLLSLPPSAAILHFPHVLSLLHASTSPFLPFAFLLSCAPLSDTFIGHFFCLCKDGKTPQWLLSTLSHGFFHKASRLLPAYQPPLTHCGLTMAGEAPASRPTAWVFLGGAVCGRCCREEGCAFPWKADSVRAAGERGGGTPRKSRSRPD